MKKSYYLVLSVVALIAVVMGCEGAKNPLEVFPSKKSELSIFKKSGNPSATGCGTVEEGGVKSTFTFNAVQQKDGTVRGHLVYHFRVGGASMWMDIDCLNIIGNQATLSGTVTKVTGNMPPFVFVGQKGVFKVEDNGEGNGAPPDQISDVFLSETATCLNPVPKVYLPVQGNIQVNP